MKKILLTTLLLIAFATLTSCSKDNATSVKADETTIASENVKVDDPSLTKPHTDQLYNDIFSIKVDDSFNGKFDTVVEPNYIELYDLESIKNGFNGLLFAVCAFDKPDGWAGAPCEKVGELTLNNGTVYDIVIGYPTESQFGFDREMPEQYKKLYDARYDIAKTVTGKNGETIQFEAGTKGDDLYNEALDKLLTGLKEDWDPNRFESENMSSMYKAIKDNNANYLDEILYAYHDVNLDGIDELLIGEKYDENDRFVIYDLYTMVDRKPTHVVTGYDRSRYYSVNGSFITNEYSNSAFESGVIVYALATNSTNLIFQLAIKYDSYTDEKEPWFIAYSSNKDDYDWEKISEDDYNSMSSRFDKSDKFEYKTLKEYKQN